jgi:hypothetical protein
MTAHPAPLSDYDALLTANLNRVFNERDAAARLAAVDALFVADPVFYEPDEIIHGRQAIADVAGALLEKFGPDFTFVADGRAVGHHGLAYLRWHAGPRNGPAVVTGADLAEIVDGRIARLWVMLDPPAA